MKTLMDFEKVFDELSTKSIGFFIGSYAPLLRVCEVLGAKVEMRPFSRRTAFHLVSTGTVTPIIRAAKL